MNATAKVVCAALLLLLHRTIAIGGIEHLRVHSTQPAWFDLVFSSVVSDTGKNPIVALNDMNGRTHIARVGDMCAGYMISNLVRRVESVFDPTIQASRKEKRHRLILAGGTGDVFELEMGQKLAVPGKMACLVMTDTGEWAYVRNGSCVRFDTITVDVRDVLDNTARIVSGIVTSVVEQASAQELSDLAQLWQNQREASSATAKKTESSASAWPEGMAPEQPAAVAPAAIRALAPSRLDITITSVEPGPNGLYPAGYTLAGGPRRGPDGRWVMMPWVVVPAFPRFSTFQYSTK